ncbi:MAG: pyrroline-5-carboxylate reductase [Gammaproteobacteria bacterium]|nr:pyrroline-5-carboxylate reductase [Gammaproteobacteria bacterium]
MRIAFVGGGHMTTSLVGGLLRRGTTAGSLRVSDPVPAQLERLARDFGVRGTGDNREAIADADLVVLAVKPQDMASAARGISRELCGRRRVVVSIAAGIRLADLARWIGEGIPTVRAMPNRPALIGAGITALYAGDGVSKDDRDAVDALMSAVGETVWLDQESQMDVVTAVSGSGPAYFFLLVEALESAGMAHGLPQETARRLAVATALGAGRMAAESGVAPAILREQVTSKGGTTAAALEVLEEKAVRAIFHHAVEAATRRSAQLAVEFGGK